MTLPLVNSLQQGIPVLTTGACGNTEYWLRDWLAQQYGDQANVLLSPTGHPDIQVVDSRSSSTDDIREIRSSLLNFPASFEHRYLVIKNIESLHRSASASLLKTLEEPLSHVRIILTSRVPKLILPTITSRVLTVSMPRFSKEQVSQILTTWGVDKVTKRVAACGGDVEIAKEINVEVLDSWGHSWELWVAGSRPDVKVFYQWSQILPEQNVETLTSCCSHLLWSIGPKMWSSRYWTQVGSIALGLRGKLARRMVARQELSSRLFDIYALVKTANARNA